ncbi:DEAD/DEAH box helicase [Streptomyces sp. KY70]|uniref:DEAD/DEAH box helicase n=1 Tax=Streptomyces sp. KY70 TaxID=2772432 RepID=UPI001929D0CE|nr:DEAD/DEAH box helicase [Streptomyces sp. KY70]
MVREMLTHGQPEGHQFEILKLISQLTHETGQSASARELLLRILDRPAQFSRYTELIDSLLRTAGLFPYATPDNLSLPDLIAYEAHRPLDYDNDDVVFHEVQAKVYGRLMSNENVILSAPTSFGKSLVLDALIASGKFSNVAVVLPTIALIDETRKRLSRFRGQYRIITHPTQPLGERNLLVMTQERILDLPDLPQLDLFMIDEFYKLDISRGEPDRGVLLNQALQRLMRTGATFYLAGPNIHALASSLPQDFVASFVSTSFATVVSDVKLMPTPPKGGELEALSSLCAQLDGPTLIYCQSPARARVVARSLMAAGVGEYSPELQEAADWIGENYHPEWLLCKSIPQGIGIHHGKIPRALSQYQVGAFNAGHLKFLVCTSTLIEGVNTSAKNVVVFDHKLNRKNLDFFTFSNIKGRSGRMMRHFVGNVYLFRAPPQEDLPTVDVPLYSQGPQVPDSLLIQVDDPALLPRSRERIEKYRSQTDVPLEVLKKNSGLDPQSQIALAKYVRRNLSRLADNLAWSGWPEYEKLQACCELIVNFLHPVRGRMHGVSSARQLALRMNVARGAQGDVHELILRELANPIETPEPDDAVENVLDFLRYWPGFTFPRLLMALESIVSPILQEGGYEECDYSAYASSAKGYFLPRFVAEVEDYGLPIQLAMKILRGRSYNAETMDDLLGRLERAREGDMNDFETGLYRTFVEFL